ncbi:MAG: penicillin-binding protein 1B [Pseudomonadota bacterium]
MPKTRSRRRKSRRRKSRRGFPWGRLLLTMLVLVGLVGAGYFVHLSKIVRDRLEGPRWALPARVYARPLELYSGSSVTREQLEAELGRLGYRKVKTGGGTGTWRSRANGILLNSRPFRFWDGDEPTRELDVRVGADGITAISDLSSGAAVALVRLEPLEIGSIHPQQAEDRVLLRRGEIPPLLVDSLLAVEDRAFYGHMGINPKSILRAVLANLRAGRTVQGGSTLTQQLVKNFFLTPERSLKRKAEEALMALVVESRYEKEEILEAYVNEIFLGQEGNRAIHGFGLASYFYFNSPVAELDVSQIALLMAMIKGPSYYNPRRHPDRALERRNLVLDILQEQGLIDAGRALDAKSRPLGVTATGRQGRGSYPAFLDLVRRQLRRDYRMDDLVTEGLRIFTTLDPWAQHQAEKNLSERLASLEAARRMKKDTLEGAVVVVTPQDGEVLALAGGRDADFAGFNRALDAQRPIGSLVKPAVYLAALQDPERYSLSTLLDDSAVVIKGTNGNLWTPKNYDGKEHGWIPLQEALAKSYNLATVRLGRDVGIDRVMTTLRAMGVTERIDPYPSLFLGALSMSPLAVAQMYQTLASGGFRSPLRAIREVLDTKGEPLQRYPLTVQSAGPPAPIYLVNRALQRVVKTGTARYLNQRFSSRLGLAGKTGTTDELRDSWYAGYSGDLVTVVWVGRDDNRPAGLSGSSGALRVWADVMARLNPQPVQLFAPATVETASIDPGTGLLSGGVCRGSLTVPYVRGYAPRARAPCAGGTAIARQGAPRRNGAGGFLDNGGHPEFDDDSQGRPKRETGEGNPISRFLRSIFR